MKKTVLFSFVMFASMSCIGQWNADPAVNTLAAGLEPLRTNNEISASPDGSIYISSWKAIPDTNVKFEFWLQRLNDGGYPQWGDDGIMISNNPCRTWLSGNDLAVADNGNIIMAIEDLRSGDGYSHVALYCYDEDGQTVWDSDGIQADTGNYASYSPVLAVTPAGNVFVAWNCIYNEGQDEQYAVRIKKYGPDGTAQWAGAKEFTGPDSTFIYPALVSVGEDDVIMVWQRKFRVGAGVAELWYSFIHAQRFDANGQPVWANDVKICDHGDSAYLMPQYLEVALAKDDNDGIFLSWNDGRFDPVSSNSFVQYLSADGNLRWQQNGIAVSPVNTGHHRTLPLVACDATGENAYLIWNERQNTSFGLCGQKISSDGSLAWGDLGITFRDFTPDTLYLIAGLDFTSSGNLLALDYLEFFLTAGLDTVTTDLVSAYKIDPSGELVWTPGQLDLATSAGIKSVPVLSEPIDDMYVISWVENREVPMIGFGSIYAQNFDLEGSMGPLFAAKLADPGRGMIIYPNPASDVLFIQLDDAMILMPVEVSIIDGQGRKVYTRQFHRSTLQIDVGDLPAGVYLIRVDIGRSSASRKVMIGP